jgi:hypothetical protein
MIIIIIIIIIKRKGRLRNQIRSLIKVIKEMI